MGAVHIKNASIPKQEVNTRGKEWEALCVLTKPSSLQKQKNSSRASWQETVQKKQNFLESVEGDNSKA